MEIEETKAIRYLEWTQSQMRLGNLPPYNQDVYKSIDTLLNRLEQLEKENGQLRVHYATYLQGYEDGKAHKTTATQILAENMKCELCKEHTKRNSIPKSVIRDKIEELDKVTYAESIEFNQDVIEILKEILGGV